MPRAFENVIDASRFPFIHHAMLGQSSALDEIESYDVEQTNEGLRAGLIIVSQPARAFSDHMTP